MKFARTLEQECVPEWRAKYVDYKTAKKHIKSVVKTVDRARGTSKDVVRDAPRPSKYGATATAPRSSGVGIRGGVDDTDEARRRGSKDSRPSSLPNQHSFPAVPLLPAQTPTKNPMTNFGANVAKTASQQTLELPEPALTDDEDKLQPSSRLISARNSRELNAEGRPPSAYEIGRTSSHMGLGSLKISNRHDTDRPLLRRIFSVGTPLMKDKSNDIDMMAMDQVRTKQREFFHFMDRELEKVETFYKSREDEAGRRLKLLRDQLHEMRDQKSHQEALLQARHSGAGTPTSGLKSRSGSRDQLTALIKPIDDLVTHAKSRVRGHYHMAGKTPTDDEGLKIQPLNPNDRGDYSRRAQTIDIPYRTAKRKLKLALLEFYRGMELLKSYALLNRQAFRKINKKYDKAIDARPTMRYMTDTVDKAWFVRSDALDGHMQSVEDLFARYFEKGNRKVATGKLRASIGKIEDQSRITFWNGLMIGVGAIFLVHGIIYASRLLQTDDPILYAHTTYLLQIYGGYLLALYLFAWFCIDCKIWTVNKINYTFIFEFDARHSLDWRELSAFPSFFLLLLGLCTWLNFSRYASHTFFLYYPVLLMFITCVVIFMPFRVLYYRSRKWLVYSHGRLLLAGLFPVEFRDFFLGDMYCSLTYVTANVSLFFCLYANDWDNPSQCNSSHSTIMGFLACLPAVWRALQCIRRYYDTRNIFPHLVNCGKYLMTISYLVALSRYRMHRDHRILIVFSTLAGLNAVYVSLWDLLMDWSLLQARSKKRFLRNVRGLKPTWPYYLALILDPILRFNWIFYSIFTHDLQHSSIVSFLVAFSEISRRGMWSIFRVENEHCANVAGFKASRDVPLPYDLEGAAEDEHCIDAHDVDDTDGTGAQRSTTGSNLARTHTGATFRGQTTRSTHRRSSSTVRRRRAGVARSRTLTDVLAEAHTQDFEKKKRSPLHSGGDGTDGRDDADALADLVESSETSPLVGGGGGGGGGGSSVSRDFAARHADDDDDTADALALDTPAERRRRLKAATIPVVDAEHDTVRLDSSDDDDDEDDEGNDQRDARDAEAMLRRRMGSERV